MKELYHMSENPNNKYSDLIAMENGEDGVVSFEKFNYFTSESLDSKYDKLWNITPIRVGEKAQDTSTVYRPGDNDLYEHIVQNTTGCSCYKVLLSPRVPITASIVNCVLMDLNYIFEENFVYRGRSHRYTIKTKDEVEIESLESEAFDGTIDITKNEFKTYDDYVEKNKTIIFNYCGNKIKKEKEKVESINEVPKEYL